MDYEDDISLDRENIEKSKIDGRYFFESSIKVSS